LLLLIDHSAINFIQGVLRNILVEPKFICPSKDQHYESQLYVAVLIH